jgi:hypothetical protein
MFVFGFRASCLPILYTFPVLTHFFFSQHLDDKEEIQMVVHKHWLLGIKSLWLPSLFFVAVWSLLYFVHTQYAIYGISLAATAIAVWWIRNFMDYYLDAWLVTNKGVIDLAWHGWFHRTSARVLYSDIQGLEYEIHGIVGTLLGYGEISLEKISTGTTISMEYVKRPRKVESVILECMETYTHKKNLKDATAVQNILAEFVASTMQKREVEENVKKSLPKKPPVKR